METYWLIGRLGRDDKLPAETTHLEPGDEDIYGGGIRHNVNTTEPVQVDI